MKELQVKQLTVNNFKPFGQILSPLNGAVPDADGPEFACYSTLDAEELGEKRIVANLICKKRDYILSKLERHTGTSEILAALDGDSFLCAAPPKTDPSNCSVEDISVFLIRQGDTVMMNTGVWHWIPYPVSVPCVRFLLMFKEKTGENDLEIKALPEKILIMK